MGGGLRDGCCKASAVLIGAGGLGMVSSINVPIAGSDSEVGKTRRGACLGFSSQGKIACSFVWSGAGATGGAPDDSSGARPMTLSYCPSRRSCSGILEGGGGWKNVSDLDPEG